MGDLKGDRYGFKEVRKEYAAAQTAAEVIAAVTGKTIVIDKILFSADAAGTMVLLSAAANIGPIFYYGTNGGVAIDDYDLHCVNGEALNITTTLSGNHSLWIKYYLKG